LRKPGGLDSSERQRRRIFLMFRAKLWEKAEISSNGLMKTPRRGLVLHQQDFSLCRCWYSENSGMAKIQRSNDVGKIQKGLAFRVERANEESERRERKFLLCRCGAWWNSLAQGSLINPNRVRAWSSEKT